MKRGSDSILLTKWAMLVFVLLWCCPCWAKIVTDLDRFVEYTGADLEVMGFTMKCPVGDTYQIQKLINNTVVLENACTTSDVNNGNNLQTALFLFIEHELYIDKKWRNMLNQAVHKFIQCLLYPSGNSTEHSTCNQISALPHFMRKELSTVAMQSQVRHTPALLTVVSYFFTQANRDHVRVDDILHIERGNQIISILTLSVKSLSELHVNALSYFINNKERRDHERRIYVFDKRDTLTMPVCFPKMANVSAYIWLHSETFWQPSSPDDMTPMILNKMYYTCHQDGIQLQPDDLRERFTINIKTSNLTFDGSFYIWGTSLISRFEFTIAIDHSKEQRNLVYGDYRCTFRLYFRPMGNGDDLHILETDLQPIKIVPTKEHETLVSREMKFISELAASKKQQKETREKLIRLNESIIKTQNLVSLHRTFDEQSRNATLSLIQHLVHKLTWWNTVLYSLIVSVAILLYLTLVWIKRKVEENARRKDLETLHALFDTSTLKSQSKYDVFLSYSSEDISWVQDELVGYLRGIGLKICWDQDFRHFPPGKPLIRSIADAIYLSRRTVAACSPQPIWPVNGPRRSSSWRTLESWRKTVPPTVWLSSNIALVRSLPLCP